MNETTALALFIIFGVSSQVALVAFFASRRWFKPASARLGMIAYGFASLGSVLGVTLLLGGQSWRLYTGPLLLAAWAAFGLYLDVWRRVEWRTPVRWSMLVPYVVLYFYAQMFLWWPLWDLARLAWLAFALMFVANTGLNLRGHAKAEADSGRSRPAEPADRADCR